MSKYDRLGDFLHKQRADRVPMTFEEIERLTNVELPPSARKHRPWWSNNPRNNLMTRVWLNAGFESEQVDMAKQTLVFRRVSSASSAPITDNFVHPAYGALQGLVQIMPGTDLTAPADPGWGSAPGDGR